MDIIYEHLQFWNVHVSADPSWRTCTTSARRTESANGERRRLKTCPIWSRTGSPTYRYLWTHLQPTGLALSYLHTHRLYCRHKRMVSIYVNVSLTTTRYNFTFTFLRTSFTVTCLTRATHNCRHQFAQGASDWCDSKPSRQLDLTSRVLVACQRFSDTRTPTAKDRHTNADLQKWQMHTY